MANGTPISDEIRNELKNPIGLVIPDSKVDRGKLVQYFDGRKTTVCVGDRTTERIHQLGFSPSLEIVDSLEKRVVRQAPSLAKGEDREVLKAVNPPGMISGESLKILAESLALIIDFGLKVRLEISGEEDLIALPVIAFFPGDTVTFYGQPNVGLVVVSSSESRERSKCILEGMGISSLPAL